MPVDIGALTQKALKALDQQLDHPENIPTKDLKDVAFGLLDRTNGAAHQGHSGADGFLASASARGAVLGALEGLASIAGAAFDRKGVEQRMVSVKVKGNPRLPGPGETADEERNPYEGLQNGPNSGKIPGERPVSEQELPGSGRAVHGKRVRAGGKSKRGE